MPKIIVFIEFFKTLMNIRFMSYNTVERHAELVSASYIVDSQLCDE